MFKKTAIALAVAGFALPLAAQAAGPTVYGNLSAGLKRIDDGVNDAHWSVVGPSKFGIKGDEDLGGGLSAFYKIEIKYAADTATIAGGERLGFVGLKGGFGSVSAGKQWSAFYDMVGTHMDPTYELGGLAYYGYAPGIGTGYPIAGVGPLRNADMIKYSGTFGPVSLEADFIANNNNPTVVDTNTGIDTTDIGASFTSGPITVALAYDVTKADSFGGTDDRKLMGAAFAYSFGAMSVHLGHESLNDGSSKNTAINTVYLGGSAGSFGYMVGFGTVKDDDISVNTKETWGSLAYNLSKTTRWVFEYEQAKPDTGSTASTFYAALSKDF